MHDMRSYLHGVGISLPKDLFILVTNDRSANGDSCHVEMRRNPSMILSKPHIRVLVDVVKHPRLDLRWGSPDCPDETSDDWGHHYGANIRLLYKNQMAPKCIKESSDCLNKVHHLKQQSSTFYTITSLKQNLQQNSSPPHSSTALYTPPCNSQPLLLSSLLRQ